MVGRHLPQRAQCSFRGRLACPLPAPPPQQQPWDRSKGARLAWGVLWTGVAS